MEKTIKKPLKNVENTSSTLNVKESKAKKTKVENVSCPDCRGSTRDPKHVLNISKTQFHYTNSSGDEGSYRTRNRTPQDTGRDVPQEQPPSRAHSSGSNIVAPFHSGTWEKPIVLTLFVTMEVPFCKMDVQDS